MDVHERCMHLSSFLLHHIKTSNPSSQLRAAPEVRPWRLQDVPDAGPPAQRTDCILPTGNAGPWDQAPASASPLHSTPRDPFEEKENFSWGLNVLTSVLTDTACEEDTPLNFDVALGQYDTATTELDPLLADLDLNRSASRSSAGVHDRLKGFPSLSGLEANATATTTAVVDPETTSPRSGLATAHSQSASDNDNEVEKGHNTSTDEEKTVSPSSSVGHSAQDGRWGRNGSATGRFSAASSSVKGWKQECSSFEATPPTTTRDAERVDNAHTKTEAFVLHDRAGFEEHIAAHLAKDAEDKSSEASITASSGERTVYIVGIDSATSDEYVLIRLSQFGSIRKYQLCGDPNQPTRYGFFEYNTVLGSVGCQSLDGRRMFTRPIRVSRAKDAIKGGRVVAEAHQLDLMKSAAVCLVQGIEAPTTRAKDGTTFRRGRRGGAVNSTSSGGSPTSAAGSVSGAPLSPCSSSNNLKGSIQAGSLTSTQSHQNIVRKSGEKEKVFPAFRRGPSENHVESIHDKESSGQSLSNRFDMKPVWSRRK